MRNIVEGAQSAACRERSSVWSSKGSVFVLVFAVVLMLAGTCAESSFAARGHEFGGAFGWGVLNGKGELQRCTKATGCQKGFSGSGPGQLGGYAYIAVNEVMGDVYVLDKANNRVEIFNATGTKFEGEFNGSGLGLGMFGSGQLLNEGKAAGSGGLPEEVPTGRFDEPDGIAIDNDPSSPSFGDVYVADQHGHEETPASHGVVDKFSATGEYIGQITRNPDGKEFSEIGFRNVHGVAVDSHGEVWVDELNFGPIEYGAANYTNAVANKWIASRESHGSSANFNSPQPPFPFAIDSKDNFYLATEIFKIPIEDRLLKDNVNGEFIGEVDEEVPTGAAVELSSDNVYVSHMSNVHRVDASGVSLETLSAPGSPSFTGVAVNSSTLTVYVADPANGAVDVFLPEAAGHPTVEAGSGSVKDVTATSASFSATVNPRSEPTDGVTSYSFEYGPCDTPSTCASSPYTQSVPAPEGVLAANYEPDFVDAHPQDLLAHTLYHMRLVAHNSYPGKGEGEELTFTTQATGAFTLPDGRAWELVSPANKYGAPIRARDLSEASLSGDAITYYAASPIEAQPPGNSDSVVQAVAGRGATGWQSLNINTPHETAPGPQVPLEYPFFSEDLSVGVLQPAGAFVPSLSSEASEQTPFLRKIFATGDAGGFCTVSCYKPLVSGAPGFENVPSGTVFGGAGPGGSGTPGGECVDAGCGPVFIGASPDASHIILEYEWSPLVENAPTGSLYEWAGGRLSVVSVLPNETFASGAHLGSEGMTRNAVSSNGRVVWSYASHLYMRDVAREKTVQVDEPQGGVGGGSGAAVFQAASSDGSRIFFTKGDLYECEIVEEAGELKCKLTDMTNGAGVMGTVPDASEDGVYVYFVAGVVAGAQPNQRGETAVAGEPNLYVWHAGVASLIAVLSGEDAGDWVGSGSQLRGRTARVSPNGHWFSFMSDRSLTGFDNRDAISGKHDKEVYLYHAGEAGEAGLVCASCDPTGGRPHGTVPADLQEGLGPGDNLFAGKAVAGLLPGWTTPLYQSRYLSNSGRLFFNSFDALVPQDTNNAEDVYQFEPAAVGDCTTGKPTFVLATDGCVSLISSGTSKEPSAFLEASQSGNDVFFLTTSQLSPLDVDSALDIYDAHVCAAGETCSAPVSAPVPACEGDACQSPVAPPEDPTPGSLTYQGLGNPSPAILGVKPGLKSKPAKCRKGFVKQHGKCVKKKAKPAKKHARSQTGGVNK